MSPAEYESIIDRAERGMLEASNREDREFYARAFVNAINERNAQRTPEEVAELERQRGLR